MGKPIVYCEVCGKSISAESILLQDAIFVQSSYYCKECADKLNIRINDKGKKVFKKLLKKKVDLNELPDISIQKVSEQETFFTRHRRELTYLLYSFSIFVIIFSALFIIYKYAISKPSIKDVSKEKCREILQLINNSSYNSKSNLVSLIDAIASSEDILKSSECAEEVFARKKEAQKKIEEIEDQEKFEAKLQVIESNSDPEQSMLQIDDLYNEYSQKSMWTNYMRMRLQNTVELVIGKLWQAKKKDIELGYINSPYTLEDYINQIDKFITEYIKDSKYMPNGSSDKINEVMKDIAFFKTILRNKFENEANVYKSSLIQKISDLIKNNKCDDAEKEVLNFSTKYVGTSVYNTKSELIQHIKNNCKILDKKDELPQNQGGNDIQDRSNIHSKIYPPPDDNKGLSESEKKMEESSSNIQDESNISSKVYPPSADNKKSGESEKKMEQFQNSENQDKVDEKSQQKNAKYTLFNGKDKNGWVEINKNANWTVWYGSLYGTLPLRDKNPAVIYFSKKSFKNFTLSFKYRLISGYFFVCFRMSPDKPSEKFSFISLNDYNKTSDYAEFSAKIFNDNVIVEAQRGGGGTANLNEDVDEGYIGFMISNGAEVYFKDIEVKEITGTEEDLKKSITVPLFNGKDLNKWIKSGAQAKWEVIDNAIYAENNLEKKDDNTIDMSTLSVLYFDDKQFQPDWTNYTVSFEFYIVENGFLVFGKFPTEGSAKGTLLSTHKGLFSANTWYKAEVTVTPEKIVVSFPDQDISPVEEKIDGKLTGFFGFGTLPQQKVFFRNVKLKFIE